MSENQAGKSKAARIGMLIGVIAVVACIFAALFPFYRYTTPESANEFGDAFGFLNAIVSACAFAALIITMFWQREELGLQRQELELTRQEVRRGADAQQAMHENQILAAYLSLTSATLSLSDKEFEDRSDLVAMLDRLEPIAHKYIHRLACDIDIAVNVSCNVAADVIDYMETEAATNVKESTIEYLQQRVSYLNFFSTPFFPEGFWDDPIVPELDRKHELLMQIPSAVEWLTSMLIEDDAAGVKQQLESLKSLSKGEEELRNEERDRLFELLKQSGVIINQSRGSA